MIRKTLESLGQRVSDHGFDWSEVLGEGDLGGANLGDANDVRLPTGELLSEYYETVVPALLTVGGKPLDSFQEHWECHSWANCPMAHAFSVDSLEKVPAHLRARVDQFVMLYDCMQIPWSVVQAAIDKAKQGEQP